MAIRAPQFPGDAKSGGIRFEGMGDVHRNLHLLEPCTFNELERRMRTAGHTILKSARENAPWTDHPERHRGLGGVSSPTRSRGEGASAKWPHRLTAREGMFIYVRRRKSFIELGLSHHPQTVHVTAKGRRFNYGASLETGGSRARPIILNTMQRYYGHVMLKCEFALNITQTDPGGDFTMLAKDA